MRANLGTSPSRLPDDAGHLGRKTDGAEALSPSTHFPFPQWGESPCLHLSHRRIGAGGGGARLFGCHFIWVCLSTESLSSPGWRQSPASASRVLRLQSAPSCHLLYLIHSFPRRIRNCWTSPFRFLQESLVGLILSVVSCTVPRATPIGSWLHHLELNCLKIKKLLKTRMSFLFLFFF